MRSLDFHDALAMHILGDLIKVSSPSSLPIPWWHRAPLALHTGTQVAVSLGKPADGRPGDIVATVFDPRKWDDTYRLRCTCERGSKAMGHLLSVLAGTNIVIGESLQDSDARTRSVDIFLEVADSTAKQRIQQELEADSRFRLLRIEKLSRPVEGPELIRDAVVEHGLFRFQWAREFAAQMRSAKLPSTEFESDVMLVTADTNSRSLRYRLVRKGAVAIHIGHRDEPGALRDIIEALFRADASVLSFFLKRGGALHGHAILVAVCEDRRPASVDLKLRISSELYKIPPTRSVEPPEYSEPRLPLGIMFSRISDLRRDDIPPRLRHSVYEMMLQKLPTQIGVALRVIGGEGMDDAAQSIADLASSEYKVVSSVNAGALFDGASLAGAWACDVAVCLVSQKAMGEIEANRRLMASIGTFAVLGKPVLVLVFGDGSSSSEHSFPGAECLTCRGGDATDLCSSWLGRQRELRDRQSSRALMGNLPTP